MSDKRSLGQYYTSDVNVLRVIQPLFLDSLRDKAQAIENESDAINFCAELTSLIFFDPTCGDGAFLYSIYLELKALELAAFLAFPNACASGGVNAKQFYGIDVDGAALDKVKTKFNDEPNLLQANSLRVDWNEFLPKRKRAFIVGNPPFRGGSLKSPDQRADARDVFKGLKGFGLLDYSACWVKKIAEYIQSTDIEAGIVISSSICQGVQPGILWKHIMSRNNLNINFAYRPFKWIAAAEHTAQPSVVILGLGFIERKEKYIYVV